MLPHPNAVTVQEINAGIGQGAYDFLNGPHARLRDRDLLRSREPASAIVIRQAGSVPLRV
jgi:hypothetical protein